MSKSSEHKIEVKKISRHLDESFLDKSPEEQAEIVLRLRQEVKEEK